jgi:hypothetical protein
MRAREYVNTHRPGGPSRVWLYLLTPTEIEELDIAHNDGEMDDTIYEYVSSSGWDYLLDVPWHDETSWALNERLAPGQAFCVEVGMPRFWQDYWGEWDSEVDIEIVEREPMSDRMAAYRWARYLGLRLKKGVWR